MLERDECGCLLAPAIAHLARDGSDLVVTVALPPSDDQPADVWVIQRDAAGGLVGEVFVQPGLEREVDVSIPEGVSAALERGPAFSLSLLDAERQPIGPDSPFVIKLVCPEESMCTLEPVLGVAPGDALHVSPRLLTEIGNRIDSNQPIGFDAISAARPDLRGVLLDFFWQGSVAPPDLGGCSCHWFFAHEVASLTGGAHLIWARPDPAEPTAVYGGSTELGTRLLCFKSFDRRPYPILVEAGSVAEISIPVFSGTVCPRPCDPRIEHGVRYEALASTADFPTDSEISVINRASWSFAPSAGNTSISVSTLAEVGGTTAVSHLVHAKGRAGDRALSRFQSNTEFEMWLAREGPSLSWAKFGAELEMYARSDTCEGLPALEVSVFISPKFSQANRCDIEIHKSLRIGG